MKLITEFTTDVDIHLVEEAGQKKCYIEGVFLQAGIKNKNGRVYPPETMDNEVNRYIREAVDQKRAFGELGHPATPGIGLDRVSHLITSLRKDGNNYIGKAIVTEGTPCGKILMGLLAAGAQLGVSSRGLGTLKEVNGINEVQNDFHLTTAGDVVANPSAPDAWVSGIYESADWVWNNGILVEQEVDKVRKSINRAAATHDRRKLNEATLAAWNKLMSNL